MMTFMNILVGCVGIIMTCNILVTGLSESLLFANLVAIQWSNQSSATENYILPFMTNFHYQTFIYGIVIDAGSTGTRIHIYKFRYDIKDSNRTYYLVEETIDEVRPGLSSFTNDFLGARKGLQRLLSLARKRVPASLSRLTHVTVRATAGLRLLPLNEAEALLNMTRDCVRASGFAVDRVEVMDGLEEAVQAWVTVNYLVQSIQSPKLSLGIMDLGGASTQITFVPINQHTLTSVPSDHKHNLTVDGRTIELYTHSYLGIGLMSARLSVLGARGGLSGSIISSPCVPHAYQGHWTHAGVRYTIEGVHSLANTSTFDECYSRSRSLVTELSPVVHLSEMRQRRFYLFSYFYDRVKDAGLDPEEDLSGGRITVDDYRRLATDVCARSRDHRTHRRPFLCLDLVYIYALLKDGYGLEATTSFHLAKKVNNIELGWTLGVVFDLLYRTELV